jgi:CBS domain containing-hemolysin-like protein
MIPLELFLLGVAAIYLGALEAAFSALMRLSLRLAAERSDRPDALAGFLDEPLLLFIPIRLLLGVATVAATVLIADEIGVDAAHKLTLIAASAAGFVIVFELLVPLVIVSRDPERALDLLLPTFVPIARALTPLTRRIVRRIAMRGSAVPIATGPEDVAPAATDAAAPAKNGGESPEQIRAGERRLLRSIADFGSTLVREVMTPRPDIVAIAEDATIADLRALFREQEYSRFPVFKESLDNIAGFVFIKDLVVLGPSDDKGSIAPLVRPAVVVPETKLVPELLKQFQTQQTQCAIVVDEYGGTAGLVTLEDLLEEIVGEIRDEYDVESELVVDEGHGRFVFSGKVDIDAFARRLDVEIEREGFETVGGYLLARLGRVPTVGERVDIDGLTVEVLDAERRRVTKVRITKPERAAEAPAPA